VLAPVIAVWVIASVVSGQLIARLGRTRPVDVLGILVDAAGITLMVAIDPSTVYAIVIHNLLIVGLGAALSAFVIAALGVVAACLIYDRPFGRAEVHCAVNGHSPSVHTREKGRNTAVNPSRPIRRRRRRVSSCR
jgi:hypothetical protein